MNSRFLALAVCSLSLLALFGLWTLIESGHLERLPSELPGTVEEGISLITEVVTASQRASFVAMVFGILLVLDIRALFQRRPGRRGQVEQPADNPMGYAILRVRRYVLVPVVVAWWLAYSHGLWPSSQGDATIPFIVAVAVSRRGENDTYASVFMYVAKLYAALCEGFSGRR